MSVTRKSPLYNNHIQQGARMIDFHGWNLPVQFKSIIDEVKETRSRVSVFDVSHMGHIFLEGKGSLDFLQVIITADLHRLKDGQALYSPICREDGGIIDDILLYRFNKEKYMFVANAVNTSRVFSWIQDNCPGNVHVYNRSDEQAQIAVQGPHSQRLLEKLTGDSLDALYSFHFIPNLFIAGVECLVSRTGYTGEDGFELYCPASNASTLWEAVTIESNDNPTPALPAGLGARDILRIEAGLSLYGNELSEQITPLEAGLERFIAFSKKGASFIGREALLKQKERGLSRQLWGLVMLERGIPRTEYIVKAEDNIIGQVTSGCYSPTLDQSIAMAFLDPQIAEKDKSVSVVIRGNDKPARLVKLPFYRRDKK